MCAAFVMVSHVALDGVDVPLTWWKDGVPTREPTPSGVRALLLLLGWTEAARRVRSSSTAAPSPRVLSPRGVVVFMHGFGGAPHDMEHVCAGLSARGFAVVAPELADSRCASYAVTGGAAAARAGALEALRRAIDPDDRLPWGLFGHSRGGLDALRAPQRFPLGRCAVAAGCRARDDGDDPTLVVLGRRDTVVAQHRVLDALGGSDARIVCLDATHAAFLAPRVLDAMRRRAWPFLWLWRWLRLRTFDVAETSVDDARTCAWQVQGLVLPFFTGT